MRLTFLLWLTFGCGDKDADDSAQGDSAQGDSAQLTDLDGDGYGASDCDDSSAAVHPDALEICDGVDNDCDGLTDDADSSVDSGSFSDWYGDSDGDGYGEASAPWTGCDAPSGMVSDATDCDDSDAAVNPAAQEVCDALDVDEDCDGLSDDADSSVDSGGFTTFYSDGDSDGYGDANSAQALCDPFSGSVVDATDCDDGDGSVNPAAVEVCDNVDNDCDGLVDADDTDTVLTSFYPDKRSGRLRRPQRHHGPGLHRPQRLCR